MTDARSFAILAHAAQRYGDQPYIVHLASVALVTADAGYRGPYLDAAWLHDVIEDTPVTLPALRAHYGEDVAAMVDACSGKGRNRTVRNACIYGKISAYPRAAVVKLADRIANVEASLPGSRHMELYLSEAEAFADVIKPHVPTAMWARLNAGLRRRT